MKIGDEEPGQDQRHTHDFVAQTAFLSVILSRSEKPGKDRLPLEFADSHVNRAVTNASPSSR